MLRTSYVHVAPMILLDGSSLTIEQLLAIADRGERVALSDAARDRVRRSRAVVDRRARGAEPAYGINTGFGSFAEVAIAPDALEALQLNLLRSHAAGLGDPLPPRTVRATIALRANVLAKGFSGIALDTVEALIALLNRGVHPSVPTRGAARFIRSRRGSTTRGRSADNGRRPPTSRRSCAGAGSTCRTSAAGKSRTRTRCAAPPRCTAPYATRCGSSARRWTSRPTARPTTPWSSPTRATSSPAATFTAPRSRSPRIFWRRPSSRSRRSASGAPTGWWIRRSAACP